MIALMILMMLGTAPAEQPTVRLFEWDPRTKVSGDEVTFDERVKDGRVERGARLNGKDVEEVRFEIDIPERFKRAHKVVRIGIRLSGKGNEWRMTLPFPRGLVRGRAPWLRRCISQPCGIDIGLYDTRGNEVWSWHTYESLY